MAMTTAVNIEPMTRIEGHLGVHAEADMEARKYVDAHCYATMFRGLEKILVGREPADAIWITQRVCGVCPTPHAMASTMAVEMAYRSPPPPFAVAVRNLTQMAEEVYDGALGCGILQGPDYSEAMVSKFNPDAMAEADKAASPRADLHGYDTVGDIMRGLNPVSGSLWQSCLGASKVGLKMVSLLGGKHPHVQTFVPGGIARTVGLADLETFYALLAQEVAFSKELVSVFDDLLDFLAGAGFGETGRTPANFVSYGVYDDPTAYDATYENMSGWAQKRGLTPGIVIAGKLVTTDLVEINVGVNEFVAHSYYDETPSAEIAEDPSGNALGKEHPWNEETAPRPGKAEDWQGRYSWAKSPRWHDWKKRVDGETHVLEAGPLARMWTTARAGKVPESTGDSVKFVLPAGTVAGRKVPQELPLEWKVPGSVNALERIRARAYFHAFSAYAAYKAFAAAVDLLNKGEAKVWNRYRRPRNGIGVGMTEAMRGAVAHWCVMRKGRIRRYQIITPTGWNVSPRDHLDRPGPCEQAIVETPVAEQPAEGKLDGIDVVRAVRGFDPCLGCTVHVWSPSGEKLAAKELEHTH
ncbi:MAG: nickel-dependent hydrogenase large subunit [Planctomycetota bacterium]|jgi:hydrogenase large subunit